MESADLIVGLAVLGLGIVTAIAGVGKWIIDRTDRRIDLLDEKNDSQHAAADTDRKELRGELGDIKTDVAVIATEVVHLKADVANLARTEPTT